jgi:phosphatidylserine decarboxylase
MSPKTVPFTFHRAGWPFIGAAIGVTLLLAYVGWGWCAMLALIVTCWVAYFFRDPRRVTPTRAGLIVSPADGLVVAIRDVVPDADLGLGGDTFTRISIFLNVFDVHVNRIPTDGIVRARNYRPGKYFNASLDKASVDNERLSLALQMTGEHTYKDKMLGVVQIAGLVARRIVCNAQEGVAYKTGQRFGIIRFGSRTDVYMPQGIQPLVIIGQRVLGGETILADIASSEPARQGDIR